MGGSALHVLLHFQDGSKCTYGSLRRNLAETSIKVNSAAPGHVATDFNGFRDSRTPEQGAAVAIRLAQLDSDGPTGLVFEDDMQLMW